jgi:hypothetical protein
LGFVEASTTSCNETVPIQDRVHGADGRKRDLAMQTSQLLPDLRCTPAGVLLLQLYDQLLDLEGQPVRLPVRATRAIRESFKSTVFVSGEDVRRQFHGRGGAVSRTTLND